MAQGEILTIDVQGIPYRCPPVPKQSTIRRSSNKITDQVWVRDTNYLQWEWTFIDLKGNDTLLSQDLWLPDQLEWYEQEVERLHIGSWIMINGEPVYFNNWCYFFHQWFVLQEGIYPIFKETSLEYFRIFEIAENDPVHVGEIGIKGRRVGLSSMSASIKLLIGLLESNTLSGIISKTEVDAQEMFFFVKNGLENLPAFLMPELRKVTESEIFIAKKSKGTALSADKGKNNRIDFRATQENAYDQSRKRHMTIDEAAKWLKVNVILFVSKVLETLYVGTSLVGHMSVFSSVNKGDQGGDNFRTLWDGSDFVGGKKDALGRTKTRLIRFFFAGYRGLLGYIGKYGESIIETPTEAQTKYLKSVIDATTGKPACPNPYIGAKEYLQINRDALENDPEELAEQIRKYPFTWQEVFRGANNNCKFKLAEVNAQIERIEAILEETGKKEMGRRMTFRRNLEGKSMPEDDPAGMWYILELIENNNKFVYKNNIKCPDNVIYGASGMDSYMHSKSAVEDGSDACLMIHTREKALDPYNINSYAPTAMFLGHPDSKDDFHNQIALGLEYYGIKMLAERAETSWEDYFTSPSRRLAAPKEATNKIGYLVTTKRWDGTEVYGKPSQQSKDTIEQHLSFMVEYALNNIHKIRFKRLLTDMRDFDPDERTKYDACMAWGYALMALSESVKEKNTVKKSNLKILPIQNRGGVSLAFKNTG